MTGFGAGNAQVKDEEISVEIRSVNHKFCEVKVRAPRELSNLESALQKHIKQSLARGAVDVSVKRHSRSTSATAPVVDVQLAREYQRQLQELGRALWITGAPTLRELANLPGVLRLEERSLDVEAASQAALIASEQALAALVTMRRVEGQVLLRDLEARLAKIREGVDAVANLAPQTVKEFNDRVAERVAELSKLENVDPQRLAQEVAFFAERTDVAEEMTRLHSHLEQCASLLRSTEPSGRKLDFLVQEMHREVNTTGSKSQHREISRWIIELKAELERLREQVQNVE